MLEFAIHAPTYEGCMTKWWVGTGSMEIPFWQNANYWAEKIHSNYILFKILCVYKVIAVAWCLLFC